MAIPDFQTLMRPVLAVTAEREVSLRELVALLSDEFVLSDDERRQTIPSGPQPLTYNRVAWAVTHLVQAELLARPARGRVRITERGRAALQTNPERVDLKLLTLYPEYQGWRTGQPASEPASGPAPVGAGTPLEILGLSYQQVRKATAHELLEKVRAVSPAFFEQLVIDLLVLMGYGGSIHDAGTAVGRSGDGGIDGVIKEDVLGLDVVYVQAKRWQASVGSPVLQSFAGSLVAGIRN